MATFCGKHSNCLAPISVISEIIFKEDQVKCKDLCAQFKTLGLSKVKDLANSTFVELSQISLGSDTICVLYEALEVYDKQCQMQLQNSYQEYENNNFVESRDKCLELLIHNPQDINILMLLAASYFQCKEYDQSMDCLLKIINIDPNCVDAFRNLGSNCCKKSDIKTGLHFYYIAILKGYTDNDCWNFYAKALVFGEPESKEVTFNKMLLHKPDLYMVRYEYANYLFLSNREEEALYQYQIITKDSPQFALTWNSLGCLCFKNNKEDAIHHFSKALDQDQQLTVSWLNLGITECLLDQYEYSINSFKCAFELEPGNYSAAHSLASTYMIQNDIDLAIQTYKKYLLIHPDDVDANYNLSLIYLNKLKNNDEAIKYLEKCLELNLNTKDFYVNLSNTYIKLKKIKRASDAIAMLGNFYSTKNDYESAKIAYNAAIMIDPDNAEVHWKLGLMCFQLGYVEMAEKRFKMSIHLRPDFPNVYCDFAVLFESLNQWKQALRYYKMSLYLKPNYFNALRNMIHLISTMELDFKEDVIGLCYKFLEISDSNCFEIHVELGNIYYLVKKDFSRGYTHYDKALSLDGSSIDTYIKIGNLLLDWKKPETAITYYKKMITLDPKSIIAHTKIGSIHMDQKNFEEAINSFKLVLTLQPDCAEAICNLVQCYTQVCDWQNYNLDIDKLKYMLNEQINNGLLPSIHPYHSLLHALSPVMIKEIASKTAEICIKESNKIQDITPNFKYPISLTPNGCIRVGYVSSDFGDHPTSQDKVLQSICNFHSSEKIETYFYSLSSDKLKSCGKLSNSDNFRDISRVSNTDAARQINSDGIHILINMNGYTKEARNEVFALRPASIQVLWLGYPSTSGATFIDYLITDKVCSPSEFNHHYTEKLAYMNRTVYIGDHKQLFGDLSPRFSGRNQNGPTRELKTTIVMNDGHHSIKKCNLNQSIQPSNIPTSMYSTKRLEDGKVQFYTRSQYSLPENAVVYCNFSKLYKIDPPTLSMWITILKNVPNSVLWLLKFPKVCFGNLIKYILSLGFDSSRIIFGDVEQKDDHMRRIQLADIFLDTCIYNGHTACLDSLWAGVPIVTLPGETFASRVAASQLTTLGCTETIAQNQKHYIEIAVKFGRDKSLLKDLRSTIWRLRTESKLFDCKSYAEELEVIYEDMWNNFF